MTKRSANTKHPKPIEATQTSAPNAAVAFESLVAALEGWFDKPLAELPEPQCKRVADDFPTGVWEYSIADVRRQWATSWDLGHDPENREEIQRGWDLVSETRNVEQQIRELDLMRAQNPLEVESKKRQLADLQRRHDELDKQLDAADALVDGSLPAHGKRRSLTKAEILATAEVWPLPKNKKTGRQYSMETFLTDVPNWLVSARVDKGAPGRGSATWNPALIAECLATSSKRAWTVPRHTLTKFIKAQFPEWSAEWNDFCGNPSE